MNKQRSLLEIQIAVLLFGLAGLFGKWLPLPPALIVLGRVFFASLTLALLLGLTKQRLRISPRTDYLIFAVMGAILALHWVVFFKSIQVSTVAVGLLSTSSFPVFTAFLEPLVFRESLEKINLVFAFVCIGGVFLIVPRFALANFVLQGVLWGLAAGLSFSVLTIMNRRFSQKYSSLAVAFFQDFFATLVLLPFIFVRRSDLVSARVILLLIILGVLCTAGSHTLFIQGMKRIKAQTASLISSLEPVYGIVFAFLFLREVPSLRTVVGGAVILGAVIVVSLRAAGGRSS
jgi:drug/metabolite transporter (DMT)-like permease